MIDKGRSRVPQAQTASPAAATAERPCILVVDDNAHDREIYGRMLNYNGYDVVFAATGQAALRKAAENSVDLVLLDLGLPDIAGVQVLSRLRAQPEYSEVPVIALSGYARKEMGDDAFRAGCTEYMEKPASPVNVLHTVEKLIGRAPLPGTGRPPVAIDPD